MIARALALKPRVLMLDEPTASLSGTEVDGAVRRAAPPASAQGVTMIYITHRLPEVLAICDRATVLRDGQVAAEIARDEFDEERFIFAMSGQRLQRLFPTHAAPAGAPTVLEVARPHRRRPAAAPSTAPATSASRVAAGEIVGLAGLLGSGRSEILHGIYGRVPADGRDPRRRPAGRDPLARATPARAGIALLTEDRKRDGLLFNLPVGANITIGNLEPLVAQRHGPRRPRAQRHPRRHARSSTSRRRSPQASVAHLSGGNQQKLLFARVLMRAPRVLLLDEPTKGVDAGDPRTRSTG